ncbi:hypothetical protein [Chondromyces crocatus]|uniref:Uncharacterized protein n=1 Tax=Chondromyces crocatus TaxID=52 RepID=A0A0K1EDU4_CHOCO|nr:hypothetical protein [Chondromyces crocatus]AKT39041.1 uncharacterized protein CMC5_031870 [Chondromyces crocatus]
MKLLRYGRSVGTIFDLLGTREDDMTYALGLVASRSAAFARQLAEAVGGTPGSEGGVVHLQRIEEDGRTDVEMRWPGAFHCIIEAKRGVKLPSVKQLRKYASKLHDARETKILVAVTNATQAYAERALPPELDGVPVRHLTWRSIRELARRARPDENNRNKHLLDEFKAYLTEILGMENVRSNMVYVVSLGAGGAWGLDFKEVATKRRRYFYPTQGHWPATPPNYIAFRYDARLQTIHHVDDYQVFANPRDVFPDARDHAIEPHYLLTLGPAIRPPTEVSTGDKIRQAMRVWAMIDLLLTCSTITEARDETKKRLGRSAKDLEQEEAG